MFRLTIAILLILFSVPLAHGQNASGPAVGTQIKDFSLRDHNGNPQKLSAMLSKGPVALVVFRSAGWCSQSKDQLVQLQDAIKDIRKKGLQVVGLSFDEAEVLKNFSEAKGIEFPLLADPQSNVIEELGLINTTRKQGTIRHRVAYPLTIVINPDATVANVVRSNDAQAFHGAKELIDHWTKVMPEPPEKTAMSFIKVQKNRFVDDEGNQVAFRGLAIADPDKIKRDGHWNKEHFEVIKSWGANLIRIPVHPAMMRKRGAVKYFQLLDEAVQWCTELEMYVIIDWHCIGNLRTEKFEDDVYNTTKRETLKFWDAVSERYANNSTVAFYEIFNEPTTINGDLGDCTWAQWKAIAEGIVDVIYANDKNVIPLVGGFDWAYDLQEAKANPINRPGIGYVSHPYPGKNKVPREPHWEKHFGSMAARYPVIVTEMGYSVKGGSPYMLDEDGSYRNAIIKYLDKKKISWCAWAFDPLWAPTLIKDYNYRPTHSGKFFKNEMQKNK